MKQFYKQLISTLKTGTPATVLSSYTEEGITKQIITSTDPAASARLADLLSAPGVKNYGAVSVLEDETGLTVAERYVPKPRLIILGGGHIALALVKMAALTDFAPVVFDDRPMFANKERFPLAEDVICDDFAKVFERIELRPTDYVVIITRGHAHDTQCLSSLLGCPEPAYAGMLGSRRRVAIVLRDLENEGFDKERLAKIHTPIGLRIGGVTPAEIAVSIMSEVISVRRSGDATSHGCAGSTATAESCDLEAVAWLAEHADEADALLTVIEADGSVPREAGAKMAMAYDGRISGTIGGGCAEGEIMQEARTIIRQSKWKTSEVDLTDDEAEDGMVCGGKMRILIESVK
jgi:xanthine dehydrogenase accessory factor